MRVTLIAVLLAINSFAYAAEAPVVPVVDKPATVAGPVNIYLTAPTHVVPTTSVAVVGPYIPPEPPQPVVVPDPSDIASFSKALIAAVQGKQWGMLAALVLMALVWAARKFLSDKWPWLKTDRGGAVLSLVGGFALALAAAQYAPGMTGIGSVLITALLMSISASGTYALIRKLIMPTGQELANDVAITADAAAAKAASDAAKSNMAAADAINKVGKL